MASNDMSRFFDVMARYIALRCTKIEMRSLFGQQTNKCHIYMTTLRRGYFMALHYKKNNIIRPPCL